MMRRRVSEHHVVGLERYSFCRRQKGLDDNALLFLIDEQFVHGFGQGGDGVTVAIFVGVGAPESLELLKSDPPGPRFIPPTGPPAGSLDDRWHNAWACGRPGVLKVFVIGGWAGDTPESNADGDKACLCAPLWSKGWGRSAQARRDQSARLCQDGVKRRPAALTRSGTKEPKGAFDTML